MLSASFLWAGRIAMGQEVPTENKWNLIRGYRSVLLSRSDWSQLGDAPFTADEKNAWTAYRQALRDIPQDYVNPDEVMFPQEPQ